MAQLFKSYEITRVAYWPKVAMIVGPSVILHTVLLGAALYVPAIRDALHLTKMVSNLKVVDRDYEKTKFGDVAVVQLTGPDDVFRYPDGYFNQEPVPPEGIPTVVPMPTPAPTPIPTPIPAPVPVAPKILMPPMARNRPNRNVPGIPKGPDATPTPTPGNPQEANAQADQVATKYGVTRPHDNEINRKPLKDFVAMANDLYDKKELDFSKPVEVIIEADLDENAQLVNAVVISKTGDGALEEVSKRMVGALSESGALRMFVGADGTRELGKVRFIIQVDQNNFSAQIESDAPNADRAKKMALGYGLLLAGVQFTREGHDDEIAIAKSTKVRSDGKKLIANFVMPRQQAIDLMKKQVAANAKPES